MTQTFPRQKKEVKGLCWQFQISFSHFKQKAGNDLLYSADYWINLKAKDKLVYSSKQRQRIRREKERKKRTEEYFAVSFHRKLIDPYLKILFYSLQVIRKELLIMLEE